MQKVILIFLLSILLATTNSFAQDILPVVEEAPGVIEVTEDEESVPAITEAVAANDITGEFFHKGHKDYLLIKHATGSAEIRAAAYKAIQNKLDVISYVRPDRYRVHATERQVKRLQKQGHVVSYDFIEPVVLVSTLPEGTQMEVLVHLFEQADEKAIAEQIEDLGGVVHSVSDTLVQVSIDAGAVGEILFKGVEFVEERPEYELYNGKSNVVSGVTETRTRFNLYGEGEKIAILDGGLDVGVIGPAMHDDLEGRVLSIVDTWGGSVGQSDNCVDYDGHGTHVAGIALGNGILSGSNPLTKNYGNSYAGVAPEAKLIFQCAGGALGTSFEPGIPLNVINWMPAQLQGAKIHSNSWGVTTIPGAYTLDSRDIDDFSWKNKEFLIIFAAGNNLGAGTVSAPSTAVNGLSVSGHLREDVNVRKGAEGPTADGRFKPDLITVSHGDLSVPPFQNIVSTMSSQQINGTCPPILASTDYCETGGTSQAAPRVAASAALIREYYKDVRNHKNPTSALIKATLFTGGQQINGNSMPSDRDGWGRMDLRESLPANANDFAFVDERVGLTTGQKNSYTFVVGTDKPFVLTTVWTAPKGCPLGIQPPFSCPLNHPQLVNDLDLEVIDPHGKVYLGNDLSSKGVADHLNNVEQVRIPQPVKGKYTVKITGYNVPIGQQDYAFALSYDNGLIDYKTISPAMLCRLPNGTLC